MASKLENYIEYIRSYRGKPIKLMEVCGTHTHQISHLGIPSLLPEGIKLISGPGCPVCVTPSYYIDQVAALAMQPNATVLTFGDMMRVPGNTLSLAKAKAEGGSVRMIYSPMDAVTQALAEPDRQFYVAAVGFETTLPLYAFLLEALTEKGIKNVRLLLAVKALMPALDWLMQHNPDIDGLIAPGHVSVILGSDVYRSVCKQYHMPITVAGFSYEHLVLTIYDLVKQLERGENQVHNLYTSAVSDQGNTQAQALIDRYFEKTASTWRGMGMIDQSGYTLKAAYDDYNVPISEQDVQEPEGCLCASIIMGRAAPVECPLYGSACTPEHPVGPCMVSSEGSCGIWYQSDRTK